MLTSPAAATSPVLFRVEQTPSCGRLPVRRPYRSGVESVEQRLVTPFYLAMVGLNATEHAGDRWDDLVRVGRTATVTDVKQLLAAGAWRPVVMGAWLSVAFSPKDLGPDLLLAVTRCQGSFTAPPLSVAAYLVLGADAGTALTNYVFRARDDERLGSATFVAAVVEALGGQPAVPPREEDRVDLAGMIGVAWRLRTALTATS